MTGRSYDKDVDDGLNKAVDDFFGTSKEIHVIHDWEDCNLSTGECEMRYCLIVEERFAQDVEEDIATDPSDIENNWAQYLEYVDESEPGTVRIVISYSGALNLAPEDSVFGSYQLLAAIAFGSGVFCCCVICMLLRMKPSEIKLLLPEHQRFEESAQEDSGLHPQVEMHKRIHIENKDQESVICNQKIYASPEIAEPGSVKFKEASRVDSMSDQRAMDMPLPAIDYENSDSETKQRDRQYSRNEGQPSAVRNIGSGRSSSDENRRPVANNYAGVPRPATNETTKGAVDGHLF